MQDPSSMQRKFITCFHATEQLGTSLPPATAERHVYSDHPANLSAHTDFDVEVKGQRLPNAY